MKQIKYFSKVILSLMVTIVVVFSEVSPCLITDAYDTESINPSAASNEIGTFSAKVVSGAKLQSGKYVWDAESSIAGHSFIYRVSYEFSGTGYLEPGSVKITVPKHLIKNRNGDYSDNYELGILHKSEVTQNQQFYYEETGSNEITITNNIQLSAAESGYIDISYETAETTFQYLDMGGSDTFAAEINVNGTAKSTTAPPVYINTGAKIKSTKKYGARLQRSWQSSWGTKPSDADNYYYIVWVVATEFERVTQPYRFTLNENFTSYPNANVVGYMFESQSTFSSKNYIDNQTSDSIRYDYVLIRFQKRYYDNKKKETFTNKVTSVVTPSDGKDLASSLSASDYYQYEIATYKPPTGHFYEQQHGNDNWYSNYGYYWDVSDYGLDDLRDGVVNYLNHDIHFVSSLYGYPYPWTRAKNSSSTDPYAYGKRDVKFVMTNDSFYLNDNTTAKDEYGEVRRDTNSKLLDSNDFEIEYINYSVYSLDAKYNTETLDYDTFTANYTSSDYFTVDVKIGSTWHNGAGVYNLGQDKATTVQSSYIKEITSREIVFQPNCTGYRITYSNHYYYTSINAYPYIKIKNSSYVMGYVNNNKRIYVTDVLHGDIYNPDGGKIVQFERYARDFIIGVEKVSDITQNVVSKINNKSDKSASVGWEVEMQETYRTNDGIKYVTQDTVIFYVLLPKGSTIDTSKITVFDGKKMIDSSQYEASTILNYKNSSQTLLVVNIKQSGTNFRLLYSTEYSWDAIADYGDNLETAVAFETGNSKIADGYPDNGGNVNFKNILSNLDSTTNDTKFIYDDCSYLLNVATAASAGLTKKVMGEDDTDFSTSTVVHQNGTYVYKLRYSTVSDVKNVVLFDSLENYSEEGIESGWKGTPTYIDISQPKNLGINPVVYYSTEENLDLDLAANRNLKNSSVWKTESAIGGKSKAKAIAIDLSKSSSGSAFTLEEGRSVVVDLYMKAPDQDSTVITEENTELSKAYNNVYSTHTLISKTPGTSDEDRTIHHNYTAVALRVMADINLHKYDTSDSSTAVEGVSFCLEGTSDYGTGVYQILKTNRFGELSFKNIEKGAYRLYEYEGSDDYLPIKKPMSVVVDNRGDVYIDGKRVSSTGYDLGDDPRIHTDIEFRKIDLLWNELPITGAVFCLSGKSDYDNEIIMYSESDENGYVKFENVELGTYKMIEIETDSKHIVSEIEYRVTVDENGNFLISDSETLENGMIGITNEPYHDLHILKKGLRLGYPVEGAVFTLKGTSNYGTYVNIEKTTSDDGVISFEGLEAGSYILQEISTPEEYILDDKKRVVVIEKDGTVTIDGLEQDSLGRFIVTNEESGKLEIIKKWYNDDPSTRPDNIVIHISTERPVQEVYFGGSNTSVLRTQFGTNITAFAKWTGDSSVAKSKIADGTAKRIDDDRTQFYIYGWNDNGTVYWYSNCPNVYMDDVAYHMFYNLTSIQSINMTGINTEKLTNMNRFFYNDSKLSTINFGSINTSNVTDMQSAFSSCSSLTYLDLRSFNTSKVTNMGYMFNNCTGLKTLNLSSFDTSKVQDMKDMFGNCSGLTTLNLSSFDTSNVKDMQYMFYNCYGLTSLDVSRFNTANVTNMRYMFGSSSNSMKITTLNVSSFNTAKVTDMGCMFANCNTLTSLDLSSFSTANVTDMQYMFYNCYKLKTLTINTSKFNTAKVTNMKYMFYKCYGLTSLNVSGFNTSKVTDMGCMFFNCSALTSLDVSSFSTANVTYMAVSYTHLTLPTNREV